MRGMFMENYIPNILIYADGEVDVKRMLLVKNILREKFNSKGLSVDLDVFDANLGDEDAKNADLILYWFNNNFFDEILVYRKMVSFLNHSDKAMIGCWPGSNVRSFVEDFVFNCPDTLDDIADLVEMIFAKKNKYMI